MSEKKDKLLRKKVKQVLDRHPERKGFFNFYMKKAKRLFIKGTVTVLLLMLTTTCFADNIIIPFSVYPKQLQKLFQDEGYKLDLDGNDRDVDSWGFLKNEGTQFIIYTYNSVTLDELTMIKELTFKNTEK